MSNEIIVTNINAIADTFTDERLAAHTRTVGAMAITARNALAAIACTLAAVDAEKCYEADGFASVADYAKRVFGMNKTNAYAMVRVGRDYLVAGGLESVLPHGDRDYTTTQLQALLPLPSVEVARAMADDGTISPEMRVSEIKREVRAYLAHEDAPGDAPEEAPEDTHEGSVAADEIDGAVKTLHEVRIVQNEYGRIRIAVEVGKKCEEFELADYQKVSRAWNKMCKSTLADCDKDGIHRPSQA